MSPADPTPADPTPADPTPADPAPVEPAAVELDRLRRENRLLRIETEMLRRIAMEYALEREPVQRIDQE